jgi:broad specificity phosphatase PhoE
MADIPIKHFYMIRHGETVANAAGFISGSMETPLTDKGKRQAKAAQAIIEALPVRPELIVHSNLSRARDTAAIVNERMGLPMIERASMAERCFGDWAGMPVKEWRERHKEGQFPPNGETTDVFRKRVFDGLSEILTLSEKPLLIVSHAGVFRGFLAQYGRKIDLLGNCHLYEFMPDGDASFPWKMRRYSLGDIG